jgi:signal transduction histidine kinase
VSRLDVNRSRDPEGAEAAWERWGAASLEWVPYLTLVASTIFSLLAPARDPAERVGTLALAVIAGVWVYAMFTRAPAPRPEHRGRMIVYFVGLLALASVLMARYPLYFVFAVTGFFHAAVLRPPALTIAGVAATSILINTIITGFPWPSTELWFLYGAIIVIQIVAIGFGTVLGERLSELSQQRRQAVAQLEATLEENAGLHAQLVAQAREAGVLDERARMAREIHDTIAHGLTGIVTQLEAAEQASDRPDDWQRHVRNATALARESLSEARRSVDASRPEALEGATLEAGLAGVADRWSAMSGVPVEFVATGERLPLHPEIEEALLRTAQEALGNVGKHAAASRAAVTLSYMGDVVTLDVRDDGVGFEVPDGSAGRAAGFGLTAMRQRIGRVAGTLAIESEPGGGTAVSARVPAIGMPPTGAGS